MQYEITATLVRQLLQKSTACPPPNCAAAFSGDEGRLGEAVLIQQQAGDPTAAAQHAHKWTRWQ
jgi:hypothetical protein